MSVLYNDIHRRQNIKTVNIAGDVLSIALVSTEQLADIRSGYRLSPSNSTVYLLKELIIPTLHLKKQLTNA